jgi:hypothetical protein
MVSYAYIHIEVRTKNTICLRLMNSLMNCIASVAVDADDNMDDAESTQQKSEFFPLEFLVSAISCSVTSDLSNYLFLPGYHLDEIQERLVSQKSVIAADHQPIPKYSPGQDDLKSCLALIHTVAEYILRMPFLDVLCNSLVRTLTGNDKEIKESASNSCSSIWIENSLGALLTLPLFDVTVLCFALEILEYNYVDSSTESGRKNYVREDFDGVISLICFARLVQLAVCARETSTSGDIKSTSVWNHADLRPLVDILLSVMTPEIVVDNHLDDILLEWIVFLRGVVHLCCRISEIGSSSTPSVAQRIKERYISALQTGNLRLDPLHSATDVTFGILKSHLQILGLDWTIDTSSSLPRQIVNKWVEDLQQYKQRTSCTYRIQDESVISRNLVPCMQPRFASYPRMTRSTLINLPSDYSRLHSMVLSKCPFDYPALCLVCGTILNAAGKGQCLAHINSCSCGIGAFFLIQVCRVPHCLDTLVNVASTFRIIMSFCAMVLVLRISHHLM